jgi:hypothetical protein
MTDADALAVLAEHGITGEDARTAFATWKVNPRTADSVRVQRVFEARGLA